MPIDLAPGAIVRHPGQLGWGRGMVQSVIGNHATVNFENAGKQTIDTNVVSLELLSGDTRD